MKLSLLREELGGSFAESKTNCPSLRDLEKLPYLSACIKEGLRYVSILVAVEL